MLVDSVSVIWSIWNVNETRVELIFLVVAAAAAGADFGLKERQSASPRNLRRVGGRRQSVHGEERLVASPSFFAAPFFASCRHVE